MNTEDSEFARIEREIKTRALPDAIHHTDTRESLEYITGWNDCRQAMLAEQPDIIGEAQNKLIAEQAAQAQPAPEIAIADAYRAGVDSGIAAERDACEMAIEELPPDADRGDCAAAIRARGNT